MKKIGELMRQSFLFMVQRNAPVIEAVRMMARHNVGIVCVLDGDRLVGVFSERDLVRRVVDQGVDLARTPVGDVMTTDLVVVHVDDDYRSAIRKMDQANIRHLPVVSEDRLLSMISIRDLMRVEIEDQGEEIKYLREYLYQVPSDPGSPSG
jgi:CBS domain-containing protein